MRFSLQGFEPTASAPEIRERFYSFRNANVTLIGTWLVLGLLSHFTSNTNTTWFYSIPAVLGIYIWCCIAYGRLASCFGQSSTNFVVAAFFLYPYELILGYFAFNRGIRDAFDGDRNSYH